MNSGIILAATVWLFVLIFFIIALVKHRRVRILPSLYIVIFVTFFSLLTPAGEVLLTLNSFRITLDSLLLGLRRSGILVGMVFLSRIVINSPDKVKDKTKNKLTEVFYYLNLLTEKKISFKKGHIIEAIDERLCEIWEKESITC